jgi:hypothetical protein
LLLDEIEVVAQPLGGRSDTEIAVSVVRDEAVGIEEDALILAELREKKIPTPLLINGVLWRKLLRVLLELLEAEQLRAQWLIISPACGLDPATAAAVPDSADRAAKAPATGVQTSPSSRVLANPFIA